MFWWFIVGAEADEEKIELLLAEVKGKDITELLAAGREKLASVPSGGAAVAAPGGGATAATAAPAAEEPKKEEKKEEEESDEVIFSSIVLQYLMLICRLTNFTFLFVV